jgi:hypothetical protein
MLFKVIFTVMTAMVLTIGNPMTGVAGSGVGSGGGNHDGYGQGGGNGGSGDLCSIKAGEAGLTPDEIGSLLFMREEEKVARDSYLVLGELGGLVIFDNISESEQSHMDALKVLITCYGLTDPVIDVIGSFSDPDLQALFDFLMGEGSKSAMDGLYVGALIEETDIVDIQHSIDLTVHEDIASTYESLMCGSRNHLRAFIRQIESNGGSYTPGVLDPDVFWEIAYGNFEKDCGSN